MHQQENKADREQDLTQPGRPKLKMMGRQMTLPGSVLARRVLGLFLVIFGVLGFLPILGFWMLPLGLLVLSFDSPLIRRWRRRTVLWWAKRIRKT